ncbi:ABC transporter permease, partial [Chloroflexota bacterium]
MGRYLAGRLLQMIPLVFGVTIISFVIMHAAPGNPMDVMMNPLITSPEMLARAEKELGFDQPVYIQYFRWLKQLAVGNLGYSYLSGEPTIDLIKQRLPATMLLATSALVLAYALGIPIGVLSAVKRYSGLDRSLTTLAFVGISVPEFFLCLAFVYVVSLKLDLLPTSGFGTLGVELSGPALWLDHLKYLILP